MVIESFRNIFRIKDLRNRVLFMFALLAVYRVGCYIPTPGVDPVALEEFMKQTAGTILGFVNTFTGGSLSRVAVFSLGIMPYITASIILQLLTVVLPSLERLQKEGEVGQQKITQYTRYLTVGLAFAQSLGYVMLFNNEGFGGVGFHVMGDAPGLPLENAWSANVGATLKLDARDSVGAMLEGRERVAPGGARTRELTVFALRRLERDWRAQAFGLFGLADGSPDLGFGLSLARPF